jgi:branched-chain amino acid aminotransferase
MTIGTDVSVTSVLADDPGARTVLFGSNSVQHGTAVFEGIRCYRTAAGRAAFRLDDHLRRLLASADALGLPHDYDFGRLRAEVIDAVARGGHDDCYVRPVLFTPEPRLGVGLASFRFTLGIEIWPAADAATEDALADSTIRLTISRWRRPSRRSFPAGVKATGIYALSALAKTQAVAGGFDDAVQLDPDSGRVAEATIANVFIVRGGTVTTPWRDESLLPGITRDSVLALAAELGYRTMEGPVEPADLLAADEVFLTGTAMGLRPVTAVDRHTYRTDRPVCTALSGAYRAVTRGRRASPPGWLTPINTRAVTTARPRGES